MDIGEITVKEILEKKLGAEKAARVLKEINDAHQDGKRAEDLETVFKDALKKEGLDPDEIKVTTSNVFPTY